MHVDVDRISACALGELPDPEQQAVLEHCKKCAHCGDQLAAAMLLAIAADEPAYMSHAARTSVLRHWPAAATVIVAVALVTFASTRFLPRTEPHVPGEAETKQVSGPDEAMVVGEITTDEELRRALVEDARWTAETVGTTLSGELAQEFLSAIESFESREYPVAAAKLGTFASLPRWAAAFYGASLFFAAELDGAEAVFEQIPAEALVISSWDSDVNAASYFLARIYYSTGRIDEARRWTRVATDAIDSWAGPGEILVGENFESRFASSREDSEHGRLARTDEDSRALLLERARYLFPADLAGRGWPWETGVPVALDAFEQGDFLTAAAELATVSRPGALQGHRGFHRTLLGISLYYAGQYKDAADVLEGVSRIEDLEERRWFLSFAADAAGYYLARLYAQAGRIEDARRLARIVSEGTSAWTPAAQVLLNDLS